jgi:hypothetical protein
MTAVAAEHNLLARRESPVQTYAKVAGVLALLSFIAGGFGEGYVPSRLIVATDAAATVENLKSSDIMFRRAFAGYLVEACCDITLALIFYVLLKPVHRYVSLLAAFFGLIGTTFFAAAELFYFAPTLLLRGGGYLKGFSPDQLNALALLSLRLFGLGAAIFTVFYGMDWVLRGYLIFQSGYFPKFLCGMNEYERLTYGITLAAAEVLSHPNPQMTFAVYVSGARTHRSAHGRSTWAARSSKDVAL